MSPTTDDARLGISSLEITAQIINSIAHPKTDNKEGVTSIDWQIIMAMAPHKCHSTQVYGQIKRIKNK